jgi:YaiO family outer membrane protein
MKTLNIVLNHLCMLLLISPFDSIAQNDSLPNRLSVGLEVEKHPYFNGYLTNIEWAHLQKRSTTLLKIYQGNRFGQIGRGAQVEIYPKFNQKNYGNFGLSVSDGVIYPTVHAAAHWMHQLNGGVEWEIGARYIWIQQEKQNVWLGVGGITKYWKNYLFNLKIYAVKGQDLAGQTYTFTMRCYTKNGLNYFRAMTGMAQTQQGNIYNSLLFNDFRTGTQWFQLGWYQQFNKYWSGEIGVHFEQFGNDNIGTLQRQTIQLKINKLF